MRRLIAALSVLLVAASPSLAANLDQVVHKGVQYIAAYDVQLGNIVAVEQYVSATTRKQIGKPNLQTPHRIAADILMMRDGADWYPVRAIRNPDGTTPDENDYVLLPALAAKRQNGVYIKPDIRRHAFELPIIRPMWRRATPSSILAQAMVQPAKKSGNPGCPELPPLD